MVVVPEEKKKTCLKEGQMIGKNGAIVMPVKVLSDQLKKDFHYIKLEQNEEEERIMLEEQARAKHEAKRVNIYYEQMKKDLRMRRLGKERKKREANLPVDEIHEHVKQLKHDFVEHRNLENIESVHQDVVLDADPNEIRQRYIQHKALIDPLLVNNPAI